MFDQALEYMNKALEFFGQVPMEVWAVVVPFLISGIGTQWIKRTFPLELLAQLPALSHKPAWGKGVYRTAVRLIAFALGFTPCYILWPRPDFGLIVATVVALLAPIAYKLVVMLAYRKWPHLQGKLSGYPDDV